LLKVFFLNISGVINPQLPSYLLPGIISTKLPNPDLMFFRPFFWMNVFFEKKKKRSFFFFCRKKWHRLSSEEGNREIREKLATFTLCLENDGIFVDVKNLKMANLKFSV